MKISVLFLCLMNPLLGLSVDQNFDTKNQASGIVVVGQVDKIEEGKKIMLVQDRFRHIEKETDSEGIFSARISTLAGGMIYLVYDQLYTDFYAQEGDSIFIKINPSQSKFEFSGDHADKNNYLFARSSIDRSIYQKKIFNLAQDSFELALDHLSIQLGELLKKHSQLLDAQFIQQEKKFLTLYLMDLAAKYYARKSDKELQADIEYQMQAYFEDSTLLQYNHFRGYLFSNYRGRVQNDVFKQFQEKDDPVGKLLALFEGIGNTYDNQKIKDYLYYVTAFRFFKTSNDSLQWVQNRFNELCTTKDYREDIDLLIRENSMKLSKGKIAPDFTLSNINQQKISLRELRGKVVYIDFWATWCAPCIKELPDWEKLRREYASNNDIVFLGISIDQDISRWTKYVKDKKLGGIQLIAPEGRKSSVNKVYTVTGIPRYVLIDKAGKIIDEFAPHPSSKEIRDLLKTTLENKE